MIDGAQDAMWVGESFLCSCDSLRFRFAVVAIEEDWGGGVRVPFRVGSVAAAITRAKKNYPLQRAASPGGGEIVGIRALK